MANTLETLRGDAKRAFLCVAQNYALPMGLPMPAEPVHQLFHFVEEKRWAYYLRYIARFNVPPESSAQVEGVTHSYADSPRIGINRVYHSYATLVHESVHFFSHYAFRRAFSVAEYEGATEYMTRRLLGETGPRYDVNGENDIYAQEYAQFLSAMPKEEDREQLCKAYFCGDDEIISLTRHRLNS